jgi:hypothetical protein
MRARDDRDERDEKHNTTDKVVFCVVSVASANVAP